MDKNGYFQVVIKDDGTYLRFYPAIGDGEKLRIDEVLRYLNRQHITGFDTVTINKAMQKPETNEVKVSMETVPPIAEEMDLTLSEDRMSVTARFYPASGENGQMSESEILRSLSYNGVKYGIQKKEVERFVKDRCYCTNYIFAQGTPPIQGKDAVITYHFNLYPNARPKLNEDGSVDFHNLETINNIVKGDVLATLEKEVMGVDGSDVLGNIIRAQSVKIERLKYGKDIHMTEDGLTLISDTDGYVMLNQDGRVMVSNTYEIKGDVDTSTGDIKFDGNVIVHGNVRAGFTIIANGNVEVEGVVEGARIIAQGQIVLKRGVQGMRKAILQSQGSILAKFIESAKVSSNGNIETDCIMHSEISAQGEIHVRGKKGLIVGGHVRAVRLIEVQNIGSAMGGTTIVEVGNDPVLQDKQKSLDQESKTLQSEFMRIKQMLDLFVAKKKKGQMDSVKMKQFQEAAERYKQVQQRLDEIEKQLEECHNNLDDMKYARIKVAKNIYSGTKVIIGTEFYILSSTNHYCQYGLENGIIKMLNL